MKDLVCEACWTEIFNTDGLQAFWLRQRYDFEYKSSRRNILRNADKGCNWCSFLKSVLPHPTDRMWPQGWASDQELTISLGEASLTEQITPKGLNQCEIDFGTEGSLRDWHAEFDLFTTSDNLAAGLITARPLQSDVDSPEAYLQVKQWLSRCQTHGECPRAMNAALPSRVIEVSPPHCPETPRLLETGGMEGEYLALSYCWGARQEYVLTASTLQPCLQRLEISQLSRTIRDAIKVTRSLGYKYLWVDALCIIQNSDEDKIRELSVMSQIYQGSTITIAAACAVSAGDGFLEARKVPERRSFRVPCHLDQGAFSIINIQEHEQYDDLREPINTRAWTLQEQLLSPRLLTYASHTLQWQCRTLTCNLGNSYHSPTLTSIPLLPSIQPIPETAPTVTHKTHLKTGEGVLHPILQHWMRLLISYSNRTATLPSDKLTALAGLATYFSPMLGQGYFSGIWEQLFLLQLCWQSASDKTFLSRPTQYRAPSWSWASVDGGPLYFRTYVLKNYHPYRCELVECKTTLKTVSLPFGEVSGGYLKLRGVPKEGRFHATRSQEITWQNHEESMPRGGGYWDTARGISDTAQDNVDRPIVCLPMYRFDGMEPPRVGGLMLSVAQDGLFRRIGRFSAHTSDFDHVIQRDVTIV